MAAAPVRASRRLGQNFLRARWVARLFSDWACGRRRLLEVGVGGGALTGEVLSRCRPELLVGLELDPPLTQLLASMSFFHLGFQGIHGDALKPPVRVGGLDAVYGSIPYNITGPLLSLLAIELRLPSMLLLQREVANRLAAEPGSRSYGRLSVLVRLSYRVRLGPVVPPEAFHPRPRVYSRIVYLEPLPGVEPELLRGVERLTRCMFSERNKLADKVASRCTGLPRGELGWLRGRRVYELEPREFLKLLRLGNARVTGAPSGGVEASG